MTDILPLLLATALGVVLLDVRQRAGLLKSVPDQRDQRNQSLPGASTPLCVGLRGLR